MTAGALLSVARISVAFSDPADGRRRRGPSAGRAGTLRPHAARRPSPAGPSTRAPAPVAGRPWPLPGHRAPTPPIDAGRGRISVTRRARAAPARARHAARRHDRRLRVRPARVSSRRCAPPTSAWSLDVRQRRGVRGARYAWANAPAPAGRARRAGHRLPPPPRARADHRAAPAAVPPPTTAPGVGKRSRARARSRRTSRATCARSSTAPTSTRSSPSCRPTGDRAAVRRGATPRLPPLARSPSASRARYGVRVAHVRPARSRLASLSARR